MREVGPVRRRRRAWPWVILFSAIGLTATFFAVGGWYFSGQIYTDALKSEPWDPTNLQGGTVEALDVTDDGGTITIRPDDEFAEDHTFDNMVVGLAIGDSLVVAGPATDNGDGSVSREVREVVGAAPPPGARYGLTRDVWLTPKQAGLKYEEIELTTPGQLTFPTWLIPGDEDGRWAVLVHGKGASRSEMLRMAVSLHKQGYTVLDITYQGDVGAPPYSNGMVTYGRVEWQAVEAAVSYATDQGAARIVLGGASHGGAVVLGFLDRGTQTSLVDGVILDAPASSLHDVIDEAAENHTLPVGGLPIPEPLEDVAMWLVSARYGVDYSEVDYTNMAGLVKVPLLVFQGSADKSVPQAVNDRFVQGAGAGATYVVTPDAAHVASWNVDPRGYDKAVAAFLKSIEPQEKE